MSRLQRFTPYLVTFAFALVVTQPLFRGYLLCTDDGYYHINKAVDLEKVIQAGHFFGRWMPQMAHGYGYPHFNYYAPLASYLLIALHSLGLIYPLAFHIFLFACVWLAGLTTYAFVNEWWGRAAGLAAAVVYMTAPYLGFDIMIRGALAETFAFVWPPLILFTLHKSLTPLPKGERPGVRAKSSAYGILAIFAFAALMYAHNATSLAVAPLIVGYIALLAFLQRDWRHLISGGAVLLLGLALSARFWFVALAERGLVQSDRLLVPPIFTYYTNFLTLRELLVPPALIDPLLLNPSPAKGLGLLAFLLAVAGLAAILYRARAKRNTQYSISSAQHFKHWDLAFGICAFVALLAYLFLTLPLSRPVWDNVPLIPFIQFPWRLLGAAALCAAILAGAAVHWLPKHQWLLAGVIAVTATLGHLSWWYGESCSKFDEITLGETVKYEIETHTIGTTAKGEFLPITVRVVPDDRTIAQAYIRGEPPQYLTGLPEGAALAVADPDVLDYRAIITTAAPFRVIFNQFYFPGWRATLDDQPAAIQLTPATGLMTITIPAGTHTLHFHFGDTPIRAIGDSISLAAFLSILICGLWLVSRRPPSVVPRPSSIVRRPSIVAQSGHSSFVILSFVILPLSLAALRFFVIDRTSSPLRHSAFDGQSVSVAQIPFQADFEGGVRAYGYDLSAVTLPADGFVDIAMYVSVRERVERQYWPAFTAEDRAGLAWNDPNLLPPRWHKEPPDTQYWPPEMYAQWARHLTLFPGTPPGTYQLMGVVFDKDSKRFASLLDEQGSAVAPRFALGSLTVTRPSRPFALEPEIAAPHDFGPAALLGYNLNRIAANAGDSILLTLYWKSELAAQTDYTARVGLLAPDGASAFDVALPPVNAYPTSEWRPGDEWRGQHRLQLPATLATGYYQLFITLLGETQRLGQIFVTAPPHDFARPALQFESGAVFDGIAALEGFSLDRTAGALAVTLAWRSTQTPTLSYSVFVHLQDDSGRVWAQSDSVPATWTRPTTGWVPGEFITDAHTLALPADLPAQTYHLYIGLYDPQTAARVPASGPGAGADNRVEIATIALP